MRWLSCCRRSGWWWGDCLDHCSRSCFTICMCETTGHSWQDIRSISSHICGDKIRKPDLFLIYQTQVVFVQSYWKKLKVAALRNVKFQVYVHVPLDFVPMMYLISDFTCIKGGRWHVCLLSAFILWNIGKIRCWSYISIYFHARWCSGYYAPMLTFLRKSSSNSSLEIKRPVGFKRGHRSRLIRVHPASSPQRRLPGVEILSEAPRVCGVNLEMVWWSDVLTWAKTCTAAETGSVPWESRIQDGKGDNVHQCSPTTSSLLSTQV